MMRLALVLSIAVAFAGICRQLGPTKDLCLVGAGAAVLSIMALSHGTGWARAGRWFALAVAGQASALHFINAGTAIKFQHYWMRSSELSEPRNLALIAILAFQAAMVLIGSWKYRSAVRRMLTARRLVLIFVAVVTAAYVSRDVVYYAFEATLGFALELVSLGNIVLFALAVPESAARLAPNFARRRLLPAVAAVWIIAVTALLNVAAYGNHPHIPDEVSYVYQARYFAAGRLTLPVTPAEDAFKLDLITYEPDRHYSPFPPGWPALLAIGYVIHAPWLINALLAGLGALCIWLWIRLLHGPTIAACVLALICCSPWYLFMGMSFMSHTAVLAFFSAGALCLEYARRNGRVIPALASGAALGMVSLIRPLDGVLLGAALGLRLIVVSRSARLTAAFAAGCVLIGGLALPYNRYLTGNATKFPVDAYFDKYYGPGVNSLGFGPNKGMSWPIDPFPGHGARDVAVNTALNLASVNTELSGWSIGSMIPLLLFLAVGGSRRRDRFMLVLAVLAPAAYVFYWYSGGPDLGARYWFSILPACLVLVALGLRRLASALPGAHWWRVPVAVAALCALTLINYVPWRALDKYHGYLRMTPQVPKLAEARGIGPALVLVRGQQHPDYASAAIYNPLDLNQRVPIYAWYRDERARAEAMAAFPDRPVWIIDGPTKTGHGFAIAAGPIRNRSLAIAAQLGTSTVANPGRRP